LMHFQKIHRQNALNSQNDEVQLLMPSLDTVLSVGSRLPRTYFVGRATFLKYFPNTRHAFQIDQCLDVKMVMDLLAEDSHAISLIPRTLSMVQLNHKKLLEKILEIPDCGEEILESLLGLIPKHLHLEILQHHTRRRYVRSKTIRTL